MQLSTETIILTASRDCTGLNESITINAECEN